MRRALLLGFALLAGTAAPLAAQADLSDAASAERRLRICLSNGAPGAPRESLVAAVVALRSLCYSQIERLREFRLLDVDAKFGRPGAILTPNEKVARERERDAETRRLNDEIARAVSTFTGLNPARPEPEPRVPAESNSIQLRGGVER